MKRVKIGFLATAVFATCAFILSGTPAHVSAEPSKVAESKRTFDPAFKAVSTTDIKDKMLNAINYYKDAQGSVSYRDRLFQEDIQFIVREGNNAASYIKETRPSDQSVLYEGYSEGNTLTSYNHLRNEKQTRSMAHIDIPKEKQGPLERAFKNNMQENVYILRPDPSHASDYASVLFPQDYAFWMDDFTKNYSVIGHETVLGRDATVIEGTMPQGLDVKRHATHFKFWVDTQTGILMKEIETDSNGQVVSSITMNQIIIDKGVNLNKSMLHIPSTVTDLDQNTPAPVTK